MTDSQIYTVRLYIFEDGWLKLNFCHSITKIKTNVTHHDTRLTGPSNKGGEHRAGCVISGETGC
jgi:hypothetical protein